MLNSPTFSALSAISDQAPKWAIAAIVNFQFKRVLQRAGRAKLYQSSTLLPLLIFDWHLWRMTEHLCSHELNFQARSEVCAGSTGRRRLNIWWRFEDFVFGFDNIFFICPRFLGWGSWWWHSKADKHSNGERGRARRERQRADRGAAVAKGDLCKGEGARRHRRRTDCRHRSRPWRECRHCLRLQQR